MAYLDLPCANNLSPLTKNEEKLNIKNKTEYLYELRIK